MAPIHIRPAQVSQNQYSGQDRLIAVIIFVTTVVTVQHLSLIPSIFSAAGPSVLTVASPIIPTILTTPSTSVTDLLPMVPAPMVPAAFLIIMILVPHVLCPGVLATVLNLSPSLSPLELPIPLLVLLGLK